MERTAGEEVRSSILVVGDDESLVETLRTTFEREGYCVESAFTGHEALDKAEKIRFDLVFLDIKLPDIRGDEVAVMLRKLDFETGIVFVTGFPEMQDCIDSLDIGVHDILLKPVTPGEILLTTREFFKSHDKMDEHPLIER